MKKFITDLHTHSTYSFDGKASLSEMLSHALSLGVGFYGVSEHVDYDLLPFLWRGENLSHGLIDEEEYFHGARHLQERYEGAMNVLVGAELGYSDDPRVQEKYLDFVAKYAPDYVINSVHTYRGKDYYDKNPYHEKDSEALPVLPKEVVYRNYLSLVRKSLDAPYPYDIVGHLGYCLRYAPYPDRADFTPFREELDGILKRIIELDKILEINSSNRDNKPPLLPDRWIVERYYALGGRKISYGSDAHGESRLLEKREEAVKMLKELGFTYLTVPCRGEHIKVEI